MVAEIRKALASDHWKSWEYQTRTCFYETLVYMGTFAPEQVPTFLTENPILKLL